MSQFYRNIEYDVLERCYVVDKLGLLDTWLTTNNLAAISNGLHTDGAELDIEHMGNAFEKTRYVGGYIIDKKLALQDAGNLNTKEPVKIPIYRITEYQGNVMNCDGQLMHDEQYQIYSDRVMQVMKDATTGLCDITDSMPDLDKKWVHEIYYKMTLLGEMM